MTHLGDRAAALADGQLSTAEAERAGQHLAVCRGCRDAVELERLMKHRLATLGAPEPSHDFVGMLMAMGGPSGPLPPRERRLLVVGALSERPAGRPVAAPRPGGRSTSRAPGRSPLRPPLRVRQRPHLAVAALAAACFVGAGVAVGGAGVAAGASASPAGGVRPVSPVDTLVARQGSSQLQLPFTSENAVWGRARP